MSKAKDRDFPCTSCGLCCKKIGDLLSNVDKMKGPDKVMLQAFPYRARKDGSCEKFVNGKCSVYDDRPDICNIRRRYELWFSNEDWEEHMAKQKKGCDILQRLEGLGEEWRVKL